MRRKLKHLGAGLLVALTLIMSALSCTTNTFAADEDTMGKAFIEDCDEVGYKELGGGVYALYSDIECTHELARVTTVKGDDVCLGTFPAGIYYLKQIKAPEGYVLNSELEEYEIYAGRNKSTWMMNTEQKGSLYIYHEGEKLVGWDGTNFVYEMRNVGQNAVKITAAEDIYSANGTLVYSKGEVVKERVEGNRFGSTSITGLTHGTYHVTELEDLEGYRQADVSHTVTLEYDDTGIQESVTNLIIQNERQKATLTVCAENSETAMKLTGGSYTLYAGRDIRNADGEVIVAQDTALETVQADENGDAIFTVDIPQNRDVYIIQIEAPKGYERNTIDKKNFYFNCLVYEDCEDVTVSYTFKNEKISEVPKQEPTETPKEEPKEEPIETPAEKPVETPEEVPTDQPKEQPTESVTTPKTGDSTDFFLWGGAGIMALVIILVVLKRKGILWK